MSCGQVAPRSLLKLRAMMKPEFGTMTGTDLIELREALGMSSSDFGQVVLGNKGGLKTVNRWVRKLEGMDLLPSKVQERIRRVVRDEVRYTKISAYMRMDNMAARGVLPEDIADEFGIHPAIVRTCLLPSLPVST